MTSQHDKPKRWQFSLRSLLLFGPLLAIMGAHGGPFCVHAFERITALGACANAPLPPAKMGYGMVLGECVVFHVRNGSNGRLAITTSKEQRLPSDASSFWPAARRWINEERQHRDEDCIVLQPYQGVEHEEFRKLVNGFAAVAEELEMQWAVCDYAAQTTVFEKLIKLLEAK